MIYNSTLWFDIIITMLMNLLGCGKLGSNLAYSLSYHKVIQLNSVYSRHLSNAQHLVASLAAGNAVAQIGEMAAAALTVIAVPDDHIATAAKQLTPLRPGDIVIHCSGVLSSAVLEPLQQQGAFVASLHPLRAFGNKTRNKDSFCDCDCVVEGDEEAVKTLTTLFKPLGARFIPIDVAKKATYHAGAVLASNYLITLASHAQQLFTQAGIDALTAKDMIMRLMQSNLDNIKQRDTIAEALTGPLSRNDTATITQHLDSIEQPSTLALYQAAALATLPLTNLDGQQRQKLEDLLRCFSG